MMIEIVAAVLTMIGNIYGMILDYFLYIVAGVILYQVSKDSIKKYLKGAQLIMKLAHREG